MRCRLDGKGSIFLVSKAQRGELKILFDAGKPRHPEDVVGVWIWRISLAYQRRAEIVLKPFGITHLQFVILITCAWLNLATAVVSQRDLVSETGVQEAQLSFMVKSLKAKKLVRQRAHPDDNRIRAVEVTPAGVTMLNAVLPKMREFQAKLWPSEEQNVRLTETIHTILERWGE